MLEVSVGGLDFRFSSFWVQIHGLPLSFMTKENGLEVCFQRCSIMNHL